MSPWRSSRTAVLPYILVEEQGAVRGRKRRGGERREPKWSEGRQRGEKGRREEGKEEDGGQRRWGRGRRGEERGEEGQRGAAGSEGR